jgi:hypothetical protein
VFPPPIDGTFIEAIKLHYQAMGPGGFFFAGLPAFLFSSIVNPEIWTNQVAYQIDRAIYANVASRKRRDLYANVRPFLIGT